MSSVKRKLDAKTSTDKKSNKRLRIDMKDRAAEFKTTKHVGIKHKTDAKGDEPSKITSAVSILAKEQPAFPRGGASLLTPLEKEQIQARATRDAIAEQNKSEDLFGVTRLFEGASEEMGNMPAQGKPSKQTVKKSKKTKARWDEVQMKNDSVRIEGLSFKRLSVGSLVLGQVTSVNARDLTIALPNNLTGYVPLTSISTSLTEKIEALLRDDEAAGDENKASDEDEDIDLKDYFRAGQTLRVAVTSVGDDSGTAPTPKKRKIELALDPKLTNSGLDSSNLTAGCTVQGAVRSVEDHGIILDLGAEGNKIRGFLPAKDLPQDLPLAKVKAGMVLLCLVTEVGHSKRTIKLSASEAMFAISGKNIVLQNAANIDAFLPGTAVEVLLSDVTAAGLTGKIMGMLDVTADMVHSGAYKSTKPLLDKFAVGKKIKARLISTFPQAETRKLGFSLLENVLAFQHDWTKIDDDHFQMSAIIPDATVINVDPGMGVYLELSPGKRAFAHISRLADTKVESIAGSSGAYKIGSVHKARILDFNPIDDLYLVSLQPKVLQQPFLRIEDVAVGAKVKVTVDKLLIGETGVTGLIVSLADGVTGMVPQIHLADVTLQHAEKKFREGQVANARVLSIDSVKRQIRLTLKKALVNSDQVVWKDLADISIHDSSPGTLVKVDPLGALVQFYANVKGYLPVSEMSEAYIKDATEHFRVGQVVTVQATNVNPEDRRLTLSCRDGAASTQTVQAALESLSPGLLVRGTVFEKSEDDVLLRLEDSNVVARLSIDHTSDGSLKKRQSALRKIRVGQVLQDVLILEVYAKRRLVVLCNRASLVQAFKDGNMIKSFADVREGQTVTGLVSNITTDGIFVRFAAGISGLVPKTQVPPEAEEQVDFGCTRLQPITARIYSIDYKQATPRFWLTMKELARAEAAETQELPEEERNLVEPVDDGLSSVLDLQVGRVTKARIVSVKDTQINVKLAKDVQGRIDVSEVFDSWDAIKDRKKPLQVFAAKQVMPVRILGGHDSRNHRFLPLSHRSSRTPVLELSARPTLVNDPSTQPLSLDAVTPGSSWIAFVNNVGDDHLWVNLSPTVRGRIRALDVSDDLSMAGDLETNFPLGCALRVRVLAVDVEKNHLDLTARSSSASDKLSLQDISRGTILPGRITKVSDRQLLVQLSENIIGAVDLINMADDFHQANPGQYQKNDVIRVYVVDVDVPNKKVILSIRPSKVLSSSLAVQDAELTSIEQVEVNKVYRGFVSNVSDKGLFVTLGHGVTAFVRVTNLSDDYLKEWKDHFQRDQLVEGKTIAVDKSSGHVQMSLKESVLNADYKPRLTYADMHVGDIVTGKVAKVETFGVFIAVDHSENVRGLCHRSEMAEQRIEDASKLFAEGDVVKARVLKIELGKRRVNFGMKASYFITPDGEEDEDSEMEDLEDGGATLQNQEDDHSDLDDNDDAKQDDDRDDDDKRQPPTKTVSDLNGDVNIAEANGATRSGLSVGGFDWYGMSDGITGTKRTSDVLEDKENRPASKREKRARQTEIRIDRTGDLDAQGPRSMDDYERLLLGEPDQSLLWLQYMAFHLELGDVDQARAIGERALKTISLSQDAEKLNVWVALLNLENAYGDGDSIDAVFHRACQHCDPQDIHTRLTSIYIQSGKPEKADELFQAMMKKFGQDPKIWINFATFLFDTVGDPERGRALLPRALQTLPQFTHLDLTSKFAQLEFKSPNGLAERGRTIFEGLLSSFPKRMDLINVLLDLETKYGDADQVRAVFERVFSGKLKSKQAKFFFKRWLEFEEKLGDEKSVDKVKLRAAEWVRAASKKDL